MKSHEELMEELSKLETLSMLINEERDQIAALTLAGVALGLAWVCETLKDSPSTIITAEFLGGNGGHA